MDVQDELVYAAISSNRNEKNISVRDNYLLYSKCRCPIVYDSKTDQVAAILTGHTDEVNGQSFINQQADIGNNDGRQEFYVISTAHDKTAIIWRLSSSNISNIESKKYEIIYQIESPDKGVFQTRCSMRLKDDVFLSVMTTIEGNIYLCKNQDVIQTIPTNNCYFDAMFYSTSYVDSSKNQPQQQFKLLALAGSDKRVHLYQLNEEEQLVHILDLAGFNDWIKCLDWIPLAGRDNEYLLAAACQDSLIQVWHLKLTKDDVYNSMLDRTNVSKPLSSAQFNIKLTATLETVLSGHESFVYSLCWFRNTNSSNLLQLISCSADRTIIVWQSTVASAQAETSDRQTNKRYEQLPASEGVWNQVVQLGETGEANLPFLGVCLSQDELTIYAQSLRGAIHRWRKSDISSKDWLPQNSITGHFDSVTDIVWQPYGQYLLTSSLDKTCRLHGLAHEDNKWHELARPQVHGFEINCLAPLNAIKFASGAEEKTIRTFEATQFFVKNFMALTKTSLPLTENVISEQQERQIFEELPAHAQLPALGLSNRGSQFAFDVYDGEDRANDAKLDQKQQPKDQQQNSNSKSINLSDNNSWHEVSALVRQLATTDHLDSVPHEEILLQSTLWWEKNKLFGHCNELHALASSSDGKFLASASKANRTDLASVIVWETEKFRKVATLEHHNLTITRLRFSPDNQHLLSVSRDRTWCLFERNPSGQLRNAYRKLVGTTKVSCIHERIIWDCAWTYDSRYFCTVSRDKRVIVWSLDHLKLVAAGQKQVAEERPSHLSCTNYTPTSVCGTETFDSPIQACDSPSISGGYYENDYLFAFGFEDGSLELHMLSSSPTYADYQFHLLKRFNQFHQLTIRRLAFQPSMEEQEEEDEEEHRQQSENNVTTPNSRQTACDFLLASGGDDCTLRLTRLRLLAKSDDQ